MTQSAKHTPMPMYISEDVGEDGEKGYFHFNAGMGFESYDSGIHFTGWVGRKNAEYIRDSYNNYDRLKARNAELLFALRKIRDMPQSNIGLYAQQVDAISYNAIARAEAEGV